MKKILSILLALSIACGSVMLTSCGADEKKDDDDKSVSDKERDEDEEEEDKDKDEDEESSEDEDESSEDEDESSEDEDEEDWDMETLDTFSDLDIEIFGDSYSIPFKADVFCDYFDVDSDEEIGSYESDTMINDEYTVFVQYASYSNTTIGDCYVENVDTSVPVEEFDFTINGIGVGSTVEDINDAFGTDFTRSGGSLIFGDDENLSNSIHFAVEDSIVKQLYIWIETDDFEDEEPSDDESSEDEESSEGDEPTTEDVTYAGGDVVEFSGVSFTVPEGFTCEITDGYAVIASEDEYALESINIQSTSADDINTYSQETFDEMYEQIYSEGFTSGTYEISTLGDADTIYYTASIDMSGISMELIQYCIFMDDASVIVTMGYVDDAAASTMDAFVDSFEVL